MDRVHDLQYDDWHSRLVHFETQKSIFHVRKDPSLE
jgi:hypothetical protein